jgi:hypothetical protein
VGSGGRKRIDRMNRMNRMVGIRDAGRSLQSSFTSC